MINNLHSLPHVVPVLLERTLMLLLLFLAEYIQLVVVVEGEKII